MIFYYRLIVIEVFVFVEYLMIEVNFGWLIRFVYCWLVSMMVLNMIFYVCCVYFIGGFKKFCELMWVIGVLLVFVIVLFGVIGYLLFWD